MFESAIGFFAVFALVLLRIPIAFAMGLVGMLGLMYLNGYRAAISMVGRLIIDTSQDYGLSVVPLFILMGLFVNKGGISRELYQVSNAFLGHFRGGGSPWRPSSHAAGLPPSADPHWLPPRRCPK